MSQADDRILSGIAENMDPAKLVSNLNLWSTVEKTDPGFVKDITLGRRHFSTIDAHYSLKRATALWGPFGDQWGFEDLDWSEIRGQDSDGKTTVDIVLKAIFYYPRPGGRARIPVIVDMPFRPNGDTFKKLRTAARSKALSDLGFSADVFMGRFDSPEYVTELKKESKAIDSVLVRAFELIGEAKTRADLATCSTRANELLMKQRITIEAHGQIARAIERKAVEITED
jgi:hypothetical protein